MRPRKLTVLLLSWIILDLLCLILIVYLLSGWLYFYFSVIPPEVFEKAKVHTMFNGVLLIFYLLYIFIQLFVVWRIWKGNAKMVFWLKVFAWVMLFGFPFGTILGIATLILLRSKEVKLWIR